MSYSHKVISGHLRVGLLLSVVGAVVVVMAASVMVAAVGHGLAQQAQRTNNIMGLNTQNINNTLDSQRLLVDRAMLHNVNNTSALMNGNDLLGCVQTLLLHGSDKSYKVELGNCDGKIINHMTIKNDPFEHGYGNNQTMIKLAYAFLKARGIE
jgi:hypothetical protein